MTCISMSIQRYIMAISQLVLCFGFIYYEIKKLGSLVWLKEYLEFNDERFVFNLNIIHNTMLLKICCIIKKNCYTTKKIVIQQKKLLYKVFILYLFYIHKYNELMK